jgi:hypothetical protein
MSSRADLCDALVRRARAGCRSRSEGATSESRIALPASWNSGRPIGWPMIMSGAGSLAETDGTIIDGRRARGCVVARSLHLFGAGLLTVVLTAGCASGARIAEIQQFPGRYADRTVSIDGVVTTAWSIPLVPYRFYRVDDGTGEITVLARNERIPSQGARVTVRGHVNEVGSFGGRAVGLHIEQDRVSIHRR